MVQTSNAALSFGGRNSSQKTNLRVGKGGEDLSRSRSLAQRQVSAAENGLWWRTDPPSIGKGTETLLEAGFLPNDMSREQ